MAHMVYDNGVWKPVNNTWTYDGGIWKPVNAGWVYDSGVWKPFHTGAISIYPNTYASGNNSNPFIRKINANGDEVWEYTGFTSSAGGLAVNGSEYLFAAAAGNNSFRKLDPNGNEVWSRSITAPFDIAVDQSDSVYVVHNSGFTKFASDGSTVVWNHIFSNGYGRIEVTASGECYVAHGVTLRKISSAGAILWTQTRPNFIYGIAVDTNGDVYVVDSSPSISNNLSKYDALGNLIYSIPYGAGSNFNDIVVGDGLYFYTSISESDKAVRHQKSDGALVNYVGPNVGLYATNGIALDPLGFIRIARGDGTIWNYNLSNTLEWTYNSGGWPYQRIITDPGTIGAGFWI